MPTRISAESCISPISGCFPSDHAEITMQRANSSYGQVCRDDRVAAGGNMTAIIYNFDRWAENDSVDETERLFSALERYTTAQLLELLYVGEEPGFFELVA